MNFPDHAQQKFPRETALSEAAIQKTEVASGGAPPITPVSRILESVARNPVSLLVAAGAVLGVVILVAGMGLGFESLFLSGALIGTGATVAVASLLYGLLIAPHREAARQQLQIDVLRHEIMAMTDAAALVAGDGSVVAANPAYIRGAGKPGRRRAPQALMRDDSEAVARFQKIAARLHDAGDGDATLAEFDFTDGDGVKWRLKGHVPPGLDGHVLWRVVDPATDHRIPEAALSGLLALTGCMDNAPVGLFTADREGRIKYANETFAKWLGRDRLNLCGGGLTLPDIIAGDDGGAAVLFAPVGEGSAPVVAQIQLKPASGGAIDADITRSNFVSAGGGEINLYLVFRRPEPGRDWRRLLEEATQRFERFFDHAPLGMVLIRDSGEVIEGNASFHELVSATAGDDVTRSIHDFIRDEDRAEVENLIALTGRGEQPVPISEIRLRGEAERIVQLYTSTVASTDSGRSVILYLVDVTDQKSLELQFAQSQKMQAVGQLAGGIAHDFNNLLTDIIGFSDLLLMRHRAGDPSFSDIMQIKQNANRAANLIRQLLAFSRQQTLRTKVLVITDVLADISSLLRRLIGENIEFKMIHGRDLGPVKGDQGQLEQVIINLAVNARDAMPDGGTLTVRTANVSPEESQAYGYTLMPSGDYILIEVSDTGIGIPKEDAGKIFEPFYTTKDVGEGTGLGLSTVYGIIKQTGGFIFIDSEAESGAVFRIFLPVFKGDPAEGARKAEEPARPEVRDLTGRSTILLVEDEEAVRIFAARALTSKGYTVIEANSGAAALDEINNFEGDIDLLISDVVMPEMDGPSLVRHATQRRPDMKVIFISGYTEDAFREKVDREQISFLPKPFSLKQLARTVKDVLQD